MGLINFLKRSASSLITRATSNTSAPARWFVELMGGGTSASGIVVNTKTAMKYNPVWSAVTLLAETVGGLPLHTFQRAGDDRQRVVNPLATLVGVKPNPDMHAMQFWEAMMGWALLWGNAFAEIERDNVGRPIALWILPADRIRIHRQDTGELFYVIDGMEGGIPARNMLHNRGFSRDGIVGLSPISQNQDAIGRGMGASQSASSFYANDSRPGGILEHPSVLKPEAAERLKKTWEDAHRGSNRNRVAVLESGMQWKQVGVSPKDAQFLESQQFSITDIARIYHIPPHKLADLSRSTFSNIEEQNIDFLTQTLSPWLNRIAAEVNLKLMPDELFVEHIVAALLRGNTEAVNRSIDTAIKGGFMTINEGRRIINQPAVDGGDNILVPLNMTTLTKFVADPEPVTQPGDRSEPAIASVRAMLVDLIQARIVTKEVNAMRRGPDADAIQAFYDGHRFHMCNVLAPAVRSFLPLTLSTDYLHMLTAEVCNASREAMLADDREQTLSLWESVAAETLADRIITDMRQHHEQNN